MVEEEKIGIFSSTQAYMFETEQQTTL